MREGGEWVAGVQCLVLTILSYQRWQGVELESTSLIPNVLMRKVILSWRENEGAALVEAAKKGSQRYER